MDNRVSQTPNHGEDGAGIVDARSVIIHFGSLKLWSDGSLEVGAPAASESSNAAASALLENPALDRGSLLGHNFFKTQGQESAQNQGQQSLMGLQDYRDSYVDMYDYKQASMEPLYGYSSTSKYVENNPVFLQDSTLRSTAITNNVIYTGFDYGSTSSSSPASGESTGPRFDLSLLQEIVNGGGSMEMSMLLLTLQGSYLDMMLDRSLSLVFIKLVKACRGLQLDLVLEDVLSCAQSFILAAFCKQGANSICKLIQRVKKSSHAFTITQILSTQFLAIMTHEIARSVIQTCFDCFLHHNQVLYEKAILHCQELATDKVGCISLNEAVGKISGEQRSRLLKGIADCSAELSNHPYGNYVVQNALSLKNESAGIVLGLRGHFVELALHPGGSHVVERCMEVSHLGLVYVVKEIVETPKASLRLAQNQFGNYVIQKAFKMTKEHRFTKLLHKSLIRSLEPYYRELSKTMSGKIVLGNLREEVGFKWRNRIDGGVWRSNKDTLL
ncbi:putative pumilio homolog 8, chloroplastic [Salvia miltiorrhiza]|uniref:putative pumilio homolog 8, chloroplastic n=1 Tax=Salvia miltiorrhiza TaxID=226208 RepID=UPI0025AC918B|nr:putative pumilio homolog 8, chloroplastic [Salvia miltiorrhiza]